MLYYHEYNIRIHKYGLMYVRTLVYYFHRQLSCNMLLERRGNLLIKPIMEYLKYCINYSINISRKNNNFLVE